MNLIAQKRREHGLTQAALAEKLAIPATRLSEFERRPLPARIYRLRQIAEALGVSLDELVGEEQK